MFKMRVNQVIDVLTWILFIPEGVPLVGESGDPDGAPFGERPNNV